MQRDLRPGTRGREVGGENARIARDVGTLLGAAASVDLHRTLSMSILTLVRSRTLPGFSRSLGMGAGLLALAGCGATDPPPLGSLDPNSTTFPGAVQSVSTVTGTSTTGAVMGCVPEAPASDHISDFSDWLGT